MADPRLKAVYEAAGHLFIRKGYASTQVSQIAEAANMATGTIYNLFTGKKAILHFVLLCTFDKEYLERDMELPVREVDDQLIEQWVTRVAHEFFASVERKPDTPAQPFGDLLSTLFDYAAAYQVAFNIINDNRDVLTGAEATYRQCVARVYKAIEDNLLAHIERGEVRRVEEPELHIRNIVEGITWWSMYLPYQAPEVRLPVDKAKSIALDILKHAYLTNPG